MWLVSVDPPAHVVYSKMGNLLWSKGNSEDGKDLQKREEDILEKEEVMKKREQEYSTYIL